MGRLGVVLFVVLSIAMAGGVYYISIYQPTQTWQDTEPVEGTVQSTDVERQNTDNGFEYRPVVTYQYSYDGRTFTNDDFSLVGDASTEGPRGAEEKIEPYSAGETVTVEVVTTDPSRSYLERGSVGFKFYGIVVFLAFLGGVGVLALVADILGVDAVEIK